MSLESPLSLRTVGAVDFFLALAAAAATAASRAASASAASGVLLATGECDEAAILRTGRLSSVWDADHHYSFLHNMYM